MSFISREQALSDIASAMNVSVDELNEDTNLMEAGMDSIRIMSLIEQWRQAGVAKVDFVTLAVSPVVSTWLEVASGSKD